MVAVRRRISSSPALWAFLVGAVFMAGSAGATVVSGRVTNGTGAGVSQVDLDFIDRDTDLSIPLLDDDTDLLGFYAVSVPMGDYDIRFKPPVGVRLVGAEERGVRVEGGSMTLDQILESGFFLSGRVVTPTGSGVSQVDLDVIDSLDGGVVYTPHDNTDVLGNFSVVLPAGGYSVEFEPALGSFLVPRRMDGVVISLDLPLGDVVLDDGSHLMGEVAAFSGGLPLAGVKVLTLDPATGLEIFNIRNTTDTFGLFDLVVAPGSYDLQFLPGQGAAVLSRLVAGVSVLSHATLPTVLLDPGVVVTGRVTDTLSNKVEGVDLDFIDVLSNRKQFTPHDNTDDNGDYAVTVRPGTYDLTFDAPAALGLAPTSLTGTFLLDTSLPTVTLGPGMVVSGVVVDALGVPLFGVDLDFIDMSTGQEIFTAADNTDISGNFAISVPAGTYDVKFEPVQASGHGGVMIPTLAVAASVGLGQVALPLSVLAVPAGVSPLSGPATGGVLVTVTGSGFMPGARVRIGGVTLSGTVRLDDFTLQGTTKPGRAGLMNVEVLNPGSLPAILPAAFANLDPVPDVVLSLDRGGPVDTDVILTWTSNVQGVYTIFRSTTIGLFADVHRLDVVNSTSFRDEGGVMLPGLVFYLVQ